MDRLSAEDNAARQSALNWVNTATKANQWRLQVLSRRYRKDPKTGVERKIPTRIRRFLEGCPPSCIREALDIILEQAPYSGIIYNGNVVPGVYRPTLTEWRRDDNLVINGQQRTDGTYTLVQDLVENDSDESWSGPTSADCTEEVVSEYHWDEPDVAKLPLPEQGVTYAIHQVSRADDGTFNYVLVKRTAKTQITDEVVQESSEFETTTIRTWKNVYGTPDAPVDESGTTLDIPTPCGRENGVLVERNVQPNNDCTYNITVQKKTAVPVETAETTAKTVFQHDSTVEKKAQDSALPEAPAASGGVVKRYKSELRPDGKYDTTESTTTEKETLQSTVVVSVTHKGKRTSITNRNQGSPASTTGLPVGTEVRTEKTEGGLHNNTVTIWEPTDRGKVAEKCQSDLFTHIDEKTGTVPDMPTDHVSGGGSGGHVISRTSTVDNDTGIITQTVTDRQEKPVSKSVRKWTTTTRGTTYEEKNSNQVSVPKHPGTVGSSTVVERTEGGLYTYTVRQFSASVKGDTGSDCSKTIFSHVHRTLTNSASPYVGHVPAASGGLVTSVTSRRNEDGGYDQTVEQRQDLPVQDAVTETSVSLHGRRITKIHRNMESAAKSSGKIGSSVRNEKTDSGLVNQTITEADAHDVGTVKEDCAQSAVEHRHSVTSNVAAKPTAEASYSDGVIVEKAVAATEYGTYDVTTVTRMARALSLGASFGTVLQKTTSYSYRNQQSVSVSPGGKNVETRASLTRNEFGLVDGTVSSTEYYPTKLGPLVSGNTLAKVETIFGRNVDSVPSQRGGVNQDGSLTATANDHGSYDYTVRMTTYQPFGPSVIATTHSGLKKTEVHFAKNVVSKPNIDKITNRDVSISAAMNDHGSYDWSARVDTYEPYGPELVATVSTPMVDTKYYLGFNTLRPMPQGSGDRQSSSLSVSMNQHGTFDTHEVVRTPKEKSYRAVFTSGSGNTQKTHHLLVYRNSSEIRTLTGSLSASASASINEFGLLDGSASAVNGGDGGGGGNSNFFNVATTVTRYERKFSPDKRCLKRKVTARRYDVYDLTLNVLAHYREAETTDFGNSILNIHGATAYAQYYKDYTEGKWIPDNP